MRRRQKRTGGISEKFLSAKIPQEDERVRGVRQAVFKESAYAKVLSGVRDREEKRAGQGVREIGKGGVRCIGGHG